MTKLHYRDSSNNWKELSLSIIGSGGAAIVVNAIVVDNSTKVTVTNGTQTVVGNVANGVATMSIPSYGTWTFTSNGTTASSVQRTFNVSEIYTIILGSQGLANDSWETVNKIALSGYADQVYNVGDTKTLAMSSTSSHPVMIIGINQDTDNSITFQTVDSYWGMIKFDNPIWSKSSLRSSCANYYGRMEAKNYVKTLSKGTDVGWDTINVKYTDETVWIPSMFEMGLGGFQYATPAIECTQGKNKPYSYYTDNESRIKDRDYSGTGDPYWTRSRFILDDGTSNYTGYICEITDSGAGNGRYGENVNGNGGAPAFCIGV